MVSAAMSFQSGFPINVQQAADSRLGGQNANRPNLSGADLATAGDFYDRLASADHPTATWLNPAAFTLAPAGTFGNTPRTITDVRTPSQRNVDASFIKNIRLAGTKTAQFKMEIINVLNRPNVRTLQGQNVFGNANFGRTNTQAGFMRQFCSSCSGSTSNDGLRTWDLDGLRDWELGIRNWECGAGSGKALGQHLPSQRRSSKPQYPEP